MLDKEIEITTKHGTLNAFVTHPETGGPHPVVMFYMDAPGKREELHDAARRLGTVGYYVILPNLYYRWEKKFVVDRQSEESVKKMRTMMAGLSNAMVVQDTQDIMYYCKQDKAAQTEKIG